MLCRLNEAERHPILIKGSNLCVSGTFQQNVVKSLSKISWMEGDFTFCRWEERKDAGLRAHCWRAQLSAGMVLELLSFSSPL